MDAAVAMGPAFGIPIGVSVYDVEGAYIGKVIAADAFTLVVSCGLLFPSHHEIPMAEFESYDDGDLFLKRTKAEVLGEDVSESRSE